jgi:hypothetical protein
MWLNIGMLCHFSVNALGLKVQNFVLRFMGFTGDLNLMASGQLGFIMDKHVKSKVCSIPSFEGVLHRISLKSMKWFTV